MIKILNIQLDRETDVLTIKAGIEDKEFFKNVYVDKIIIDDHETYSPVGPSSNAIYTYTVDGNLKEITIEVPNMVVNGGFYGKLLFIYATAKGVPLSTTPCGQDETVAMKVAADYCSFYNKIMPHIKELSNTCKIPRDFIDNYLKFKAIQVAVNTKNFQEACNFWTQFYSCQTPTYKSCGCNG